MSIEYEKARGWFGLISSGGGIGFIIGIVLAIVLNDGHLYRYIIGMTIFGMFIGWRIAVRLSKKYPLDEWYTPSNRSADLDNFQEIYLDKAKDDILLELLPSLSDSELITAFAYQYYDLLKASKPRLKEEIHNRTISKVILRDLYERHVLDFRYESGDCPRCGSMRYNKTSDPEKPNCMICGYNIVRDNPAAFQNRLRKLFGMYNDRRLSWTEVEMHLEI
jgi:ribosomal protein L37E